MKKLPLIKKGIKKDPKKKEFLKSSEHEEQSAFCSVLDRYHLPYFAIPNGGKRASPIAGRMLKMEGVKPGVPDLFILRRCLNFKGLFMEFKTKERRREKDGGLSRFQLEWKAICLDEGYGWEVVYGWEDGVVYLTKYNLIR